MKRRNEEILNDLIEFKLLKELENEKQHGKSTDDFDKLLFAIDRATKLKDLNEQQRSKLLTLITGVAITPVIDYGVKKVFAKMLCEFEKDYTFTTTAGKTLSSIFKFK